MSVHTKRLTASFLFCILSLVSTITHAWDVTPLDIKRMEGESAVVEIIIESVARHLNGSVSESRGVQ